MSHRTKNTKSPEPKIVADSLRAAVAILKTHDIQLSVDRLKKMKADGCPAFRSGRVHIRELLQWLQSNPEAESTEGEESKEALERRRLLAQCEKLEHELAVTRGEYIHRSQFESDAIRVADLVRTEFLAFHADQVTWAGLDEVERDRRGKARVRESLGNLKKALCGK